MTLREDIDEASLRLDNEAHKFYKNPAHYSTTMANRAREEALELIYKYGSAIRVLNEMDLKEEIDEIVSARSDTDLNQRTSLSASATVYIRPRGWIYLHAELYRIVHYEEDIMDKL